MSDSNLLGAIPVLPVRDIEESISFYRDRLGFASSFKYGPYAGVTREAIEIHLSVEDAAAVTCRVGVRGVDALYLEMQTQDVIHPDEPLASTPWGMRQFSVLDPSGNRITFAEPSESTDSAEAPDAPLKKFMITFTHVEGANERVNKQDLPALGKAHQDWERAVDAQERSSLVYLKGAEEAKTVRRDRDGKLEVLDGPFTQGAEAAGGFFIIEAESLDDAVEFAKDARWMEGSNEVREITTYPGMKSWIRS